MPEAEIYLRTLEEDQRRYNLFAGRISGYYTTTAQILAERLRSRLREGQDNHFFSVGIGDGRTELMLLQHLSGFDIVMHGIEPGNKMYTELSENAEAAGILLGNIFREKWEDHQLTRQYDFVMASQSWYGIQNQNESLARFQDAIAPGGIGCIIIENDEHDFMKFKKRFCAEIHGIDSISSSNIARDLRRLGIPFTSDRHLSQELNTDFLLGEDTEEKVAFLSYMLKTDYTRLPESLRQEIDVFVRTNEQGIWALINDYIWIEPLYPL